MERLRVGVVGAGVQGMLHARTLAALPRAELAAVAEVDESRRAAAGKELGVPVVARPAELLDSVDAVSICLPDHLHEEAALTFLAAGKRVLLEKPMAMSTDACDRILAGRRDPDALMIGHILRFDPRVIRAREAVRGGDIGDLWHVKVWRNTSQAVGEGIWDRASVAWFLGIHDADLLRYVTGREVEVTSAVGGRPLSRTADIVHAHIRLSGGVVGTMENSWTLPHGRPSRADAGMRITGSDGIIELDLSHNDLRLIGRSGGGAVNLDTYNWPSRTLAGPWNLRTELEAFTAAALDGAPSPVTGEDGRAAVAVIEDLHARLDVA